MTPDQFIQAIEPWIEIANTVITLYWAVVLLPAFGCAAGVYAVIAGERWISAGYLPGSGYQPRGKDTGVRIPPRGGSASVRPQDRSCEAGDQPRASLPLSPLRLAGTMRTTRDLLVPDRVRR